MYDMTCVTRDSHSARTPHSKPKCTLLADGAAWSILSMLHRVCCTVHAGPTLLHCVCYAARCGIAYVALWYAALRMLHCGLVCCTCPHTALHMLHRFVTLLVVLGGLLALFMHPGNVCEARPRPLNLAPTRSLAFFMHPGIVGEARRCYRPVPSALLDSPQRSHTSRARCRRCLVTASLSCSSLF
jgi:hypothetical protein